VPDPRAAAQSELRDIVERCASGELPPNVALMRLHMAAPGRDGAATAITAALQDLAPGAEKAARLDRLAALHRRRPTAWDLVHRTLASVRHDDPDRAATTSIAEAFDMAARISPEGSVALYSLGDRELLAAASEEIVARMKEWRLIVPECTVLDLGCGIGRIASLIAAEARLVVGIDVSREMLRLAARQCAGLNVSLVCTSGLNLAMFADAAFDTIVAVDSFPYVVQSGLSSAARHLEESARLLRPGGALLILNFSYGDDQSADCRDAARMAERSSLLFEWGGIRPFELWDGAAFLFRKP
jgi:SAM-dependent methyltransferase